MKTEIGLRIELEVPAQRLLNTMRFYNEDVEKQVEEGVNLAIKELSENESIARMVADEIKKKMNNSIVGYVLSYEVQNAIQKSIGETISNKIQEYADEVAEKIYDQLKPTNP